MYYNINLFTFFIFFLLYYCDAKRYTNYTLYRGLPINQTHLEFFIKLEEYYDVNYWTEPRALYAPVDFVINPMHRRSMLIQATEYGVFLDLIQENVQSAFDQQKVQTYMRSYTHSMNWDGYFTLQDIYSWLDDLAKENPHYVTVQSIGTTYGNKNIMSLKVAMKGAPHRSVVIIEGGIHAREWISPAFVTYLINKIVHAPLSKDDNLKYIASIYEWHFVPILNPDGYDYSHTDDRLWRKNRNGYGVDLNRNFDAAFDSAGFRSFNPHSDTFCGPRAFSEKESQAMAKLVMSHHDRIEYYISFHSYGQYIIIPYTHSSTHDDNYDEVYAMCQQAADHIYARFRTTYSVGTAYETLGYMATGVSMCWVKEAERVPYAITVELRDRGRYGFGLPPHLILPTCQETFNGMMSFLTPRSSNITRLGAYIKSSQVSIMSDQIVIVLNVLLFIIVF